jgi:hypothetical protein
VRASYAGEAAATQEIELREGERRSVVLDVAPPQRRESLQRTLGWTSLALGAAGITTGAIAGAVMLNEKATLDQRCQPSCPADLRDEYSSFRTARAVSFVGWGVGVAGLAVGTTLLVTASEPERPFAMSSRPAPRGARLAAVVGPASVALRGEF